MNEDNQTETGIKKVAVFASFKLKEGAEIGFNQIAKQHARNTLRECAGCLQYDVVKVDSRNFTFYEVYQSLDWLEEHRGSSYLAVFRTDRLPFVLEHNASIGEIQE